MGREPRSVLLDSKKQGLVGGKGVKSFHSFIPQEPMRVWTELAPLECEVPDCVSCTVELIPLSSYIWNLSAPRSQWSVTLFFFWGGGEPGDLGTYAGTHRGQRYQSFLCKSSTDSPPTELSLLVLVWF